MAIMLVDSYFAVFSVFFMVLLQNNVGTGLGCDGSQPLGVSTGRIGDDAISASSTYPSSWDAGCDTRFGRLLRAPPATAWCSSQKSASEWLQIDLGFISKVTSVATQGRTDGREWVSAYHLSFSTDGQHWEYVRDRESDEIRVFAGNSESHSVKHNYFEQSIMARFVKFHPIKWHGHPSMRVELFGCQDCTDLISVQPWAQLRASSQWLGRDGNRCRIENAFLYSSGAWCPKKRDVAPWLEYDFGPPAYVTAIATRGKEPTLALDLNEHEAMAVVDPELDITPTVELTEAHFASVESEHRRASTNQNGHDNSNSNRSSLLLVDQQQSSTTSAAAKTTGRPQWVSAFKILYRNDTNDEWTAYSDSNVGDLFVGNSDPSTIKLQHLLRPFVARYVRFVPVRWSGYPAMRAAVFGCARSAGRPTESSMVTSVANVAPTSSCPEMFLKPGAETPCVENLAFKKKAWSYMKRHHKRHLPSALTTDIIAEKVVDGNVTSSQHTCMPLNNAQVSDPTWMVDIGRRSQISGVLLWLWHPTNGDNSTLTHVERGLRWLDKIVVFVTAQPVSRAASLNNYEGKHLCATVKNFDNRFARETKPLHFICTNSLVGRYIYVVAIGVTTSSNSSANKFHTSICEVMAYS